MHEMTIVGEMQGLGNIWQCDQCERLLVDRGRAGPMILNHGNTRVSHVSAQEGRTA